MKNKHIGRSLNDFLAEENLFIESSFADLNLKNSIFISAPKVSLRLT